MPYKISGTLSDAARIIVIKESDWSIESNTTESVGAYEVDTLASGTKLVAARKSDGEVVVFGDVESIYYVPPARGVFAGGDTAGRVNVIDYITITTPGSNAQDFGDLLAVQYYFAGTSNGSSNRGVFGGGADGGDTNTIEYITISSAGNGTNFGDLTEERSCVGATSNGTGDRGVFAGAQLASGSPPGAWRQIIDYITISSTGNAVDFGDLTPTGREYVMGLSNATNNRGVFGGGNNWIVIDYITITSPGNATDFGDLSQARQAGGGVSNGTNDRGVFGGGNYHNVIDYITITSTGNATDFGDMNNELSYFDGTSNGTGEIGVFGGGTTNTATKHNTIDYITINSVGNATDFGDLTVGRRGLAACSNA